MSKPQVKKRVSKGEWLDVALDILANEGIEGVRIEVMADRLGISKSGFYWHFKNREDLYRQLLDTWAHESTLVITENPDINSGPAVKRLESILETVNDYELGRAESAIFIWSRRDALARKVMNQVYNLRLSFARALFKELGFRGDELEARTHLFVVNATHEHATLSHLPKSKRSRLIKRQVRLMTKK